MKTMLLFLAAIFTTSAALSHPGKTDAKGGHTDARTGKYHVHTKPEAKKEAPKKPAAKKGEAKKKKQ